MAYKDSQGNLFDLHITCNVDAQDRVKEVFCANPMRGSDIDGLIVDGCILISLLLQMDTPIERIASILSELRPEFGTSGPPASVIGAVARAALLIDSELQEEEVH